MRYYHIIAALNEGYKEVQAKYIEAGHNQDSVAKTIETFRELVNKNQVKGNERNIDWWGKNKSFDDFAKFVNDTAARPTKSEMKKGKRAGKSINLVDNDEWLVVLPLDKEASCFHGRGSSWCTTKPHASHFEEYFYDKEITLIYCLQKQSGGMWAIASHRDVDQLEMFDQKDNSINQQEFKSQTGMDPYDLVTKARQKDPDIGKSRDTYKTRMKGLKVAMQDPIVERNRKIEDELVFLKDDGYSAIYLRALIERNVDTTEVPEAIQVAAVKHAPGILFGLDAPKQTVIDSAVDAHPDMLIRIIKKENPLSITDRTVRLAVMQTDEYTLPKLLTELKSEGVKVLPSTIEEKCTNDPRAPSESAFNVFFFLQNGYDVSADLQYIALRDFGDYINIKPSLFDLSDERVALEILSFDVENYKYISDPTEKMGDLLARDSELAPRIMMYQGVFPTASQQKLMHQFQKPEMIKSVFEFTIEEFDTRVESLLDDMKHDFLPKMKELKAKIRLLDDNANSSDESRETYGQILERLREQADRLAGKFSKGRNKVKALRKQKERLAKQHREIGFI